MSLVAESATDLGTQFPPGGPHYRAFVGPPERYDLVGAAQFNVLTALGLREHHYLLDVGCGSLRAGRLLIPYLRAGHYFGIEPEQWLIDEGIRKEVGQDQVAIKRPAFSNDRDFNLSVFGRQFDFIVAQSIFSHACPRQIRKCLAEARKVMSGTGIFAASFARGARDHEGDEWVYPHCVEYTLEGMQALAALEGLVCHPIDGPHFALSWVAFVKPEHPAAREGVRLSYDLFAPRP
jgi:SAM-dependent methyltransferase